MNEYYIYAYLDPRKPGNYSYDEYTFGFSPFYIGKGKKDRCFAHLKNYRNDNHKKVNKIKKIRLLGLEPIIIKVKENLSKEEANESEKDLIKKIRNKDSKILTNITAGGDGGDTFTGKKHSISTKILMSSSQKGKKRSDETKKKISAIRKNKTYEEIYGKEKAEQLKKAQSESRSGKNNAMFGKKGFLHPVFGQKRTHEQRKKMSDAQKIAKQKLKDKNNGIMPNPHIQSEAEKLKRSNTLKELWKIKKLTGSFKPKF